MDEDRLSHWATVFGVTILVIAGLLIVVVGGCAAMLNFDLGVPPRKHLKPIPINQRACPYVVAMHRTANAFQSSEPFVDVYMGPGLTMIDVPWRRVRTRIRRTLLDFQLAILVGRPHFPTPIRRRLTTTLDAVHIGLRELDQARSPSDLTTRTEHALTKGQTAFGYAGDLVGKQCPVQLGADSQVGQPTSLDLAEYACGHTAVSGALVDARPTTVGRARTLRGARPHEFPNAKPGDFIALCRKRTRHADVTYVARLNGSSQTIATRNR